MKKPGEEGYKSAHVTKREGGKTPACKRFGQILRDRMLRDKNQQLALASEGPDKAVSWRILKGWAAGYDCVLENSQGMD